MVLGASLPDGRLDERVLQRLAEHAATLGLATTLHRAFDLTPDPAAALEIAIGLGFQRRAHLRRSTDRPCRLSTGWPSSTPRRAAAYR